MHEIGADWDWKCWISQSGNRQILVYTTFNKMALMKKPNLNKSFCWKNRKMWETSKLDCGCGDVILRHTIARRRNQTSMSILLIIKPERIKTNSQNFSFNKVNMNPTFLFFSSVFLLYSFLLCSLRFAVWQHASDRFFSYFPIQRFLASCQLNFVFHYLLNISDCASNYNIIRRQK